METHAYYVHFHSTLHQWTDIIGCSMDILMLTVLDLFLEVVSDITGFGFSLLGLAVYHFQFA